jgi:hypothetical protein
LPTFVFLKSPTPYDGFVTKIAIAQIKKIIIIPFLDLWQNVPYNHVLNVRSVSRLEVGAWG